MLQAPSFDLQDGSLYFIDGKHNHRKRADVPHQLQQQLLGQTHSGPFGGHFSGQRTFNKLALHWWWDRMYSDTMEFCKNCPQCAIGHCNSNSCNDSGSKHTFANALGAVRQCIRVYYRRITALGLLWACYGYGYGNNR